MSSRPRRRHSVSLLTVLLVMARKLRINLPYRVIAAVEKRAPDGSSMNGMNLSGNPGIVQPMHMPPTLGQPPMPDIHPRLVTLQLTTGPQQPTFTRHLGVPYSIPKSSCS